MKKLLLPAALVLGAAVLFTVAFLGFALLRADGPHQLPLIGGMFAEPEPEAEHGAEPELAEAPKPEIVAAERAGLGLLDVFRVESPLAKDELAALASSLKARLTALDAREAELARSEARLAERSQLLDEQMTTIHALRTELERWQTDLEQRQGVLKRDESAAAARDAESWAKLSKLFEKGDAASLAAKLSGYAPEEAAQVLVGLKPDRARELLEKLGGESWKDYWDAYRRALGSQEPD